MTTTIPLITIGKFELKNVSQTNKPKQNIQTHPAQPQTAKGQLVQNLSANIPNHLHLHSSYHSPIPARNIQRN
jgi:hypothetical protein